MSIAYGHSSLSHKPAKMTVTVLLVLLILAKGSSGQKSSQQQSAQATAMDTKLSAQHSQHQNSDSMVAFYVQLSDSGKTISDGATIVFELEETNVGGLYFKDSGQFICADDGYYVFLWNIRKDNVPDIEGMRCITKLRSGGTDRKHGPKTSYWDTTWSGNAQMMAILQCRTNPPTAVTVMTSPWSQTVPAATYFKESSFAGFRLSLASPIAFTVELSKRRDVISDSRIMFDKVLSNFGEHYDPINGYFRCPDNGIYVFSISAHTTDPSTPWSVSRLMKQREVVIYGPITYIATSQYDSGTSSTTAVVQCTTGHSIYVETQVAYSFIYNSYAEELTAFTGFKLYDSTEDTIAFTAVMTSNHTSTIAGQPFIFDNPILNLGDAFNPVSSVFTCPDDDYYLFSYTITADHGTDDGTVDLYMDTTFINEVHVNNQYSDDVLGTSGTSTASVIKKCTPGSVYQVRGRYANARVFLADYTLFSGYKIPGEWQA